MISTEERDILRGYRHHLHRHPEVSGKEKKTSAWVLERLKELNGIEVQEIGPTGILVTVRNKKPGKTLFFRADMDALPIQEWEGADPRSENEGTAHLCGHDGHTISMLGFIRYYLKNPLEHGVIHFLFQPAEENGKGAQWVMDEKDKIQPVPDKVFAYHNLPGYSLGKIIYKENAFTAAANSIIIKLKGKTSHAAEPEKGINPAPAIAGIIESFEAMAIPDLEREDFRVLTAVYARLGNTSYGVSAGEGEVHYTLRTWDNRNMEALEEKCRKEALAIASEYQLKADISFTEKFFANMNEKEAVEMIRKAASRSGFEMEERNTPFKWGEDFGLFTDAFPGAMFGIGSGEECPALHNPDYQFPDEIIPVAIRMFYELAREGLSG